MNLGHTCQIIGCVTPVGKVVQFISKRAVGDQNVFIVSGRAVIVFYSGIEPWKLDPVVRQFFVGPDGDILKLDVGILIAHARPQRTAEVVLPAERRGVVIVLSSRDVNEKFEVICTVDRGRPFVAHAQTIGHHCLVAAIVHADDGAAGDRIDDGIGITAGRDAHANTASTVRHLGAVFSSGNRARLEEQIGISVPQPIVRREIIGAQLLKVNLEFYGRLALSDDKSLKAVRARHVGT